MCATSATWSIALSLIEAFGSKAQIEKANKTFLEDKRTTYALEEGIRQFTAKYKRFLKFLLTLRLLRDLRSLTMNIAVLGTIATYPVLTLLARETAEEGLHQGGKVAMMQGKIDLSEQIFEKTSSIVVKIVTKCVSKFGYVVLGSVFIIIDLWEIIRNVKDASGVSEIAWALRDQARKLEDGLKSVEDYKSCLRVQLARLQNHMGKLQHLLRL